MDKIKILDKSFSLFLDKKKIKSSISEIARTINTDYSGKNPLFLTVLNGAFMFASELFQHLDIDCEISFVKLASYQGTDTTGNVKKLIGLNEQIKNKHVIIVEDIVDTGITIDKIRAQLEQDKPASIKVASMLFKPGKFKVGHQPEYIGIEIPDDFIVGFGLDYDGRGRNLNQIYKIDNE